MEFLVIDWAGALNVAGFAFLMVFLLLAFIVLVLSASGHFFIGLEKAKKLEKQFKATGPLVEVAESDAESFAIPGEVLAAISMSVREHFSVKHDNESNIITIEKGEKRYSPWSSKIYGLHMFHRN